MAKRLPIPAPVQMRILTVLWTMGPCTIRQVRKHLGITDDDLAYTTTLKELQIMDRRRLVVRDKSQRSHVYKAAVDRELTLKRIARQVLADYYQHSLSNMMMAALSTRKWSVDQLKMVGAIVEEAMDSSN